MRSSSLNSGRPCRHPAKALLLLVLLTVAGCAGTPVPRAQLAVSQRAIEDAKTAGAAQAAPLDLQRAQDKLSRAQAATAEANNEQARRLAEEAEVDARLAAARARTARTREAAVEVQKSIRALRESAPADSGASNPAPVSR